jgi:hypothetical protein
LRWIVVDHLALRALTTEGVAEIGATRTPPMIQKVGGVQVAFARVGG